MGMWWEILPSLAIITAVSYVPFVAFGLIHRLEVGSPHMRDCRKQINKNMYFRDRSNAYSSFISRRFYTEGVAEGSPYYSYGLEKLTDKE